MFGAYKLVVGGVSPVAIGTASSTGETASHTHKNGILLDWKNTQYINITVSWLLQSCPKKSKKPRSGNLQTLTQLVHCPASIYKGFSIVYPTISIVDHHFPYAMAIWKTPWGIISFWSWTWICGTKQHQKHLPQRFPVRGFPTQIRTSANPGNVAGFCAGFCWIYRRVLL